jgi:hypothetical protein
MVALIDPRGDAVEVVAVEEHAEKRGSAGSTMVVPLCTTLRDVSMLRRNA